MDVDLGGLQEMPSDVGKYRLRSFPVCLLTCFLASSWLNSKVPGLMPYVFLCQSDVFSVPAEIDVRVDCMFTKALASGWGLYLLLAGGI